MAIDLTAILCPLSPADCLAKCDELLANTSLSTEERSVVWYFKVHALRELERPWEAVRVARKALSEGVVGESLGNVLIGLALSLYELGDLQAMVPVLTRADSCVSTGVQRGYILILRGCWHSSLLDPVAFEMFADGVGLLDVPRHMHGVAWANRSAASLALKLRRPKLAIEFAEQITFQADLRAARLMIAEAYYQQDLLGDANHLLDRVEGGEFGALRPEDAARAKCLRARIAIDAGDFTQAWQLVAEAFQGIKQESRRDIDLTNALSELRYRLRSGEVAD